MLGNEKEPGLMSRAVCQILDKITTQPNQYFSLRLSYLEVYNENIKDLLAEDDVSIHDIREDPQKGVIVTGLKEIMVADPDETMKMLTVGDQNRTKEKTLANEVSSRSHAVMMLVVDCKNPMTGDINIAKLILVDLAGSERAAFTQNKGLRMVEEANINRSLLSLGNCINALSEQAKSNSKGNSYIPYRDSKLTRLLKNSLGGNCKTIMLAAINPSSFCYEDTLQTLKYADRARAIRTLYKANVIKKEERITHYANQIDNIKKQIKALSGASNFPIINNSKEIMHLSPIQHSDSKIPTIHIKKPNGFLRKLPEKSEKDEMSSPHQQAVSKIDQQGESKITELQNKIKECFENEIQAKTKLYALDESLENIGFDVFSKQLQFAKLVKNNADDKELDRISKEISTLNSVLNSSKKNRAKIIETLDKIESEREKYTIEINRELSKQPTEKASALKYIIDNYMLNLKNAEFTRQANHANFKVRQRESYIKHLKEELLIRNKLIRERIESRQNAILDDEDENEDKMREYESNLALELPKVRPSADITKSVINASIGNIQPIVSAKGNNEHVPSLNIADRQRAKEIVRNAQNLKVKSRNKLVNPLRLYARIADRSLKKQHYYSSESTEPPIVSISQLDNYASEEYNNKEDQQKIFIRNKIVKNLPRVGKFSIDNNNSRKKNISQCFGASFSLQNK